MYDILEQSYMAIKFTCLPTVSLERYETVIPEHCCKKNMSSHYTIRHVLGNCTSKQEVEWNLPFHLKKFTPSYELIRKTQIYVKFLIGGMLTHKFTIIMLF